MRFRSQALEAFKTNNAELAIVSLEAINALMPPEFKVEVNTEKYNELRKETRMITCNLCKEENILNDVKQYDVELDWVEQILSSVTVQRMWICVKCEKPNIFNSNDITLIKNGEPFYYKVIPIPPVRQIGIRGRMTYDKEFRMWYSIASNEIESQIGVYRAEYAKQDEEEVQYAGD